MALLCSMSVEGGAMLLGKDRREVGEDDPGGSQARTRGLADDEVRHYDHVPAQHVSVPSQTRARVHMCCPRHRNFFVPFLFCPLPAESREETPGTHIEGKSGRRKVYSREGALPFGCVT